MMESAASSPSAVVCSGPVMPAGQTSSAALTFGEADDGDALGICSRSIHGIVEDAGGSLGAIDGGRIEGFVLATRGHLT